MQRSAGRLQSRPARRSQLRRRLRAAFHSLRPTRDPHLDFMSSFVDTIVAIVVVATAVLIIVLLCPHTHTHTYMYRDMHVCCCCMIIELVKSITAGLN